MEVEESLRKYLTISTHKGLYQYNRLPYGVTDSAAKWQKAMDIILQDIQGVKCIIDDIIITGVNDDKHLRNAKAVLDCLEKHGIKANTAKCEFFKPEIEFCGHKITAEELQKNQSKVRAIIDAPEPTTVRQVISFIGLVNYYHKFIPSISKILHPLYKFN